MTRITKQSLLVTGIILLAVGLDQALKLYVHSHFALGESHEILPFFQLCYVENDGMAFGIEWFNKIFLTLFRIVAVGLLGWYIHILMRNSVRTSYLTMVALVTAGALGNIVDCVCYGRLFGYAGWFYGRVVDMFYFPLIHNSDGEVLFFRPVFNFADSCITVSVIIILLFYMKEVNKGENK